MVKRGRKGRSLYRKETNQVAQQKKREKERESMTRVKVREGQGIYPKIFNLFDGTRRRGTLLAAQRGNRCRQSTIFLWQKENRGSLPPDGIYESKKRENEGSFAKNSTKGRHCGG